MIILYLNSFKVKLNPLNLNILQLKRKNYKKLLIILINYNKK